MAQCLGPICETAQDQNDIPKNHKIGTKFWQRDEWDEGTWCVKSRFPFVFASEQAIDCCGRRASVKFIKDWSEVCGAIRKTSLGDLSFVGKGHSRKERKMGNKKEKKKVTFCSYDAMSRLFLCFVVKKFGSIYAFVGDERYLTNMYMNLGSMIGVYLLFSSLTTQCKQLKYTQVIIILRAALVFSCKCGFEEKNWRNPCQGC